MAINVEFEEQARPESLDGAFKRYRRYLAKAVARIVKPGDIEDIVQETYLRTFRASQHEPIHHPRSFMLKAARNLALNHVSSADALNYVVIQEDSEGIDDEIKALEELVSTSESPETIVQSQEEFSILCKAIHEFPRQCRRAFILRKIYGLSQREVAGELGISESTVEKHIAKGLVACSAYMAEHGYPRLQGRTG